MQFAPHEPQEIFVIGTTGDRMRIDLRLTFDKDLLHPRGRCASGFQLCAPQHSNWAALAGMRIALQS